MVGGAAALLCGAWIRLSRKGSAVASVTKAEAIDSALCYGWIDGQLDKYDADSWLIRFTPRQPRSHRSQPPPSVCGWDWGAKRGAHRDEVCPWSLIRRARWLVPVRGWHAGIARTLARSVELGLKLGHPRLKFHNHGVPSLQPGQKRGNQAILVGQIRRRRHPYVDSHL